MFESADQARAEYARQREKNKKIGEELGSHLAEVSLTVADGVQTKSNARGHFAIHEYAGVNLKTAAVLIGPL